MTGTTDALVLDLVEWIGAQPRLIRDVIETWRTSCPRLTIWEDAVDRGYVARRAWPDRAFMSRSPPRAKIFARARPPRLIHHIRARRVRRH